MTYKGVYLYENTDSWREIWRDKTTNEEFYSKLKINGIKDQEYEHSQ